MNQGPSDPINTGDPSAPSWQHGFIPKSNDEQLDARPPKYDNAKGCASPSRASLGAALSMETLGDASEDILPLSGHVLGQWLWLPVICLAGGAIASRRYDNLHVKFPVSPQSSSETKGRTTGERQVWIPDLFKSPPKNSSLEKPNIQKVKKVADKQSFLAFVRDKAGGKREAGQRIESFVMPPSYWATHSNWDKYIVVFSSFAGRNSK